MYDDESILTHFQAVGHLGFHPSKPFCISIFQWLWWTPWGTQRKDWWEMLRIWMCPEGKQRLSCGLYKGTILWQPVCSSKPQLGFYWNPKRPKPITQIKENFNSDFEGKSAKAIQNVWKKMQLLFFHSFQNSDCKHPTSKDPWGPA